jgi:hypothetical protein
MTDSFATPEGASMAAIQYRNAVAQHCIDTEVCYATALRYSFVVPDPRDALRAAASRYRDTASDHEKARLAAIEAVLSALKAGITPTEVERLSPFTGAYVRRLARENGIPPAAPGPKGR